MIEQEPVVHRYLTKLVKSLVTGDHVIKHTIYDHGVNKSYEIIYKNYYVLWIEHGKLVIASFKDAGFFRDDSDLLVDEKALSDRILIRLEEIDLRGSA